MILLCVCLLYTSHALKFFTYVNDVDGRVKMFGFDDPQNDYDSMLAVFQKAYAHEQWVTKRISVSYTHLDVYKRQPLQFMKKHWEKTIFYMPVV